VATTPDPQLAGVGVGHGAYQLMVGLAAVYLSIREIQSKIAGRASRGIVGAITKRTRAAQPIPL
jgi:hypothetical protein